MLFPDDTLFDYVLADLADEMPTDIVPQPAPMRCDRWIARSALQKGCRRGETDIALAALSNLFEHDRYAIWRHLTVITLEDVGVANIDLLARIVAAASNRPWRLQFGGDWSVAAVLVRQICESNHCQAVSDLLLRATNDPSLDIRRADALDAPMADLASIVSNAGQSLTNRGLAALSIGGGLSDGQPFRDAFAVFDILADGISPRVTSICQAAWRRTKSEMAMLLPLVWSKKINEERETIVDDKTPPTVVTESVPGYAIDQFTRAGGVIVRSYLAANSEMRADLDALEIPRAKHARVIGDLIFLIEGGTLVRRTVWPTGDALRLPCRMLTSIPFIGNSAARLSTHLAAKWPLITSLRSGYTLSSGA